MSHFKQRHYITLIMQSNYRVYKNGINKNQYYIVTNHHSVASHISKCLEIHGKQLQ